MKKIFLVFLCSLFLVEISAQNQHGCFTDEYYKKQIANDPEFKKNQEALEIFTKDFIKKKSAARSATASLYIIPVVFHVIYTTCLLCWIVDTCLREIFLF